MSKAVVIHHTLNTLGGETTVAIETIESLYQLGYEVELVTVQPPDLERIAKSYGKKIHIARTKSLLPFKLNYFGVYQKLMTMLSSTDFKDSDIVINTHGDALPYRISANVAYLLYLYFPTFMMNSSGNYGSNKYRKSFFWRAYFKPYSMITHYLAMRATTRSNLILTISKFSREAIREAFPGVHPYVLYPPVDVERFSPAYSQPINAREVKVLVVSRFSPEKRIENAIKIAHLLGGKIKFQIIGSLAPANRVYFKRLQQMIEMDGLTETVTLTPNASNEELIDSMSKGMIYLHTMIGEHFGVSIVEAMAAGLLPIVPAYGGCSEFVPTNQQYHTLEEAADHIAKNTKYADDEKRQKMHEISRRFSPDNFRKAMSIYIEQARRQISAYRSSST
ncbi:MAG: glycosyltransferase [Thermoproteota archaeon]|nr:glycosyltransferase [Thermoproteota archaeon]